MSDRSMVTSSTLTVTISENITIGGERKGGQLIKQMSGINRVFSQVFPLLSTGHTTQYTTHASTITGSQFDEDLVKYVRLTNKDTYYSCDIIIENGDNDEVGINLGAGQSLVFWVHKTAIDATTTGADVAHVDTAVVGATTLADAAGNSADGTTNGQYLTVISTDQTTRTYIIVDGAASDVTTGSILTGASDIGSGILSAVVPSYADLPGQLVAVTIEASDSQNDVLRALSAAITHANGHGGKITMGTVPLEAGGSQNVTMTQTYHGASGNTVTTTDIANLTSADFTSGVTAGLSNLATIANVSAIAREASVDIEVFVASE